MSNSKRDKVERTIREAYKRDKYMTEKDIQRAVDAELNADKDDVAKHAGVKSSGASSFEDDGFDMSIFDD